MKKTFIILLIAFFAVAHAQRHEKIEEVKALKVAFITKELSLTTDEAQKFWPYYNEFEARQKELRRKKLSSYIGRKDVDINELSDKEALSILDHMERDDEQLVELRKKLHSNLKNVISPVKILKLKSAEENFSRRLLKQYREKRK